MLRRIGLWIVSLGLAGLVMACQTTDQQNAEKAMQRGAYKQAFAIYQRVLGDLPDLASAQKGREAARAKILDQAITEANRIAGNQSSATVPLLTGAINRLDQDKGYDAGGRVLGPVRERFTSRQDDLRGQNETAAKRVPTLLEVGKLEEARTAIDGIRRRDPKSSQLAGLEAAYTDAVADSLERDFMRLVRLGKMAEAQTVRAKMLELDISEDRRRRLLAAVDQAEADTLRKQVEVLLAANKYFTANKLLSDSSQAAALADLAADLRVRGGMFYLDQGRRLIEAGNTWRAYLELFKGQQLAGDIPGLFDLHRDSQDKVNVSLQEYIAIPTFEAPANKPDLGSQFSNALISYLFRVLPYGINIAERENIDLLLAERQRELGALASIRNVDLIITGNVGLMNIDTQKSEQQSIARVRVGERREINPEYEIKLKVLGPNSPRLPPATLVIPEFENLRYTKGKQTIKGFGSVAARIFDSRKGAVAFAQEFKANYEVSDEYKDSVDLAGIAGDPLELPTETEMVEELRLRLVKQVAEVIKGRFDKRKGEFVNDAKRFLQRNEVDKAMRELARGHVYCRKAKLAANDADCATIDDMVVRYTEDRFVAGS